MEIIKEISDYPKDYSLEVLMSGNCVTFVNEPMYGGGKLDMFHMSPSELIRAAELVNQFLVAKENVAAKLSSEEISMLLRGE